LLTADGGRIGKGWAVPADDRKNPKSRQTNSGGRKEIVQRRSAVKKQNMLSKGEDSGGGGGKAGEHMLTTKVRDLERKGHLTIPNVIREKKENLKKKKRGGGGGGFALHRPCPPHPRNSNRDRPKGGLRTYESGGLAPKEGNMRPHRKKEIVKTNG